VDRENPKERIEDDSALAAVRAGDRAAFSMLADRYRHQLHVHCYRMLGSFDDAEDVVQEALLRAWRGRESFEGRSLFRTWLYRIATNACLNFLERAPHRVLPQDVAPPITAATESSSARPAPPWAPEIPWLEPYPDEVLDLAAPHHEQPDAAVIARETIQLSFVAALQHLAPRQRAILLLCDVVGWSAAEVADLLETSVASVTSTLQRAHAAVRTQRGSERVDAASVTEVEQKLLQRFMDAWEQDDVAALTDMLREDARWSMPPAPLWFEGRAAIANMLQLFPPRWRDREFRMRATGSNRQPAAAAYLRLAGESEFRLTSVHVLRVEAGGLAEITTFSGVLHSRFALPAALPLVTVPPASR
jgi:RNA polymerase sigma-70 factor, ECF subfamily